MIIAVAVVRMVQVAIDEVIDVIAVGNGRVTAVRTVHMIGSVPLANVAARAAIRIGRVDCQDVLLDLAGGGWMMEVTIVEIIDMTFVLESFVTTVRAVHVIVMRMRVIVWHG
jgi:hypothetical protein